MPDPLLRHQRPPRKSLLTESAIIIEAGEGKEDRLLSGSYIALREQEAAARQRKQKARSRKRAATICRTF